MRILHISPTYHPALGGAELHAKELSEGLAARGHDVTVLTGNARNFGELARGLNGNLPETEVLNGVRVIRLDPSGGAVGKSLHWLLQQPGGWRSLKMIFGQDGVEMLAAHPQTVQLIPHLVRSKADVVMAMSWFWPSAYYAYLARRWRRFVFVGIPLFHTFEWWSRRTVYDRMLASCSAVIANTEHEAEFMSARGAGRIEVAGVGVDLPFFASPNGPEIRARYGIGDKPVVGFVGRPQASKGIIRLVEAMRIVWQWNPDVRFLCAGHGPAGISDVQVEAALKNLRSDEPDRFIRISKFEDKDKPSLYDAFDVFVLPSTEESFGLAYLEAWACRKPVIGADIGSTRCVIDDKSDGLLVNPSDPADIAQKIIELLSDRSKRESMGSRGYAKAQDRYNWPRVVHRVERLYRDLCAV